MSKAKQETMLDRLKKSSPIVDNSPHLIIEARAGTGKTTTLIEGLKLVRGMPSTLVASPQQAAVWEAMQLSKGKVQTICFVAFNKSIAMELQQRVPSSCEAMTMHSMGLKAIRRSFELLPGDKGINKYHVQDIISEILGKDIRQLRKDKPTLIKAVEELVSLCKMNLIGFGRPENEPEELKEYACEIQWSESLSNLASYYDVDVNGSRAEVFDLVPKVLERCKDVARDKCIDFNDMVWLPVALDLNVFKYDMLLIDEVQDLNRCSQALAKKAGKRLILCGDPKQAIYGFAGADSQSMQRMFKELSVTDRDCQLLPLTVTRRCGKAIVAEAKKIVPDFEAFETNPEGCVSYRSFKPGVTNYSEIAGEESGRDYRLSVQDGDMILCRVNAPLVSECFKFIRQGRKANIQGRDIGQGLISTVNKMKAYSLTELQYNLSDWLHRETLAEQAKRNPNDNRIIALQDRYDCLCCFCEGCATVDGVINKIQSIFTDDKSGTGIKLSSIHKSKGLEADRVFLIRTKEAPLPHPMAKQPWEREQEMNLLYVGITRSIKELVYVVD